MPAILGGALTPTATPPQPRGKNDIYSCEKRQGWKRPQLVLWSLLHIKWTMTAILGGGLTPTATLPQPRVKMTFNHVTSGKAKNGLS